MCKHLTSVIRCSPFAALKGNVKKQQVILARDGWDQRESTCNPSSTAYQLTFSLSLLLDVQIPSPSERSPRGLG